MSPEPSPKAPHSGTIARRFGAPRAASVPKMDDTRPTQPDASRRAVLERTRGRLVLAASGFGLLFFAVTLKLTLATVLLPTLPKRAEAPRAAPPQVAVAQPLAPAATRVYDTSSGAPHARRAMITDRNGEVLALSLPTAAVIANPRALVDVEDAVRKLKTALPRLDESVLRAKLSDQTKGFVYLARQVTPREETQINMMGVPGVDFERTERRRYPLGRVAAQVLGGVDVDGHGIAGVEKAFEQRLAGDPTPLRLSLDYRVQAVVREELSAAMEEFKAIGAAGIVMDVNTGEVLAMVSLPDFDINDPGSANDDQRTNRAAGRVYEPGSTFKLQTASMALDSGTVHIWNGFDASAPIKIGRFTINDFEGKHRFLYVPEILAYSSNIGAARMAEATGTTAQRAWMEKMGMFGRSGVELPESAGTLFPPKANWKESATLTIGFGHGIAVTPLHVVMATSAVANGGVLHHPTLLARDPGAPDAGARVMQPSTSEIMRKLMRLVVTEGFGKAAEVPGYFVGGKTGTAEKISHHGYNKNSRVSAFMSVFPMNAPRFAVYMMLDEPKADASTHGYATAGWVSAPAAGRVIARIGPMLGLMPATGAEAAAIQASLFIPLEPGRPSGAPATPKPAGPAAPPVANAKPAPGTPPVSGPPPATVTPVHDNSPPHDWRREAMLRTADHVGP